MPCINEPGLSSEEENKPSEIIQWLKLYITDLLHRLVQDNVLCIDKACEWLDFKPTERTRRLLEYLDTQNGNGHVIGAFDRALDHYENVHWLLKRYPDAVKPAVWPVVIEESSDEHLKVCHLAQHEAARF